MSIFWRILASFTALASLIVTLPASYWLTVVVLYVALSDEDRRHPPVWVDAFGSFVMIGLIIFTFWAVYRVWKPYLMEKK